MEHLNAASLLVGFVVFLLWEYVKYLQQKK